MVAFSNPLKARLRMTQWKRNFIVLCGAQFLTLMGFSAYYPFIAFYVQELGVDTYAAALAWMAAFSTGGAVSMMIASPIWGSLADRFGRKPMVVRATFASALIAFGYSIAQTPSQLLILRIAQGFLAGTISASQTLIASEVPEKNLGRSLGTMQTVQYVSQALGPLLGGFAADILGYRNVFIISGCMTLISGVSVTALVRESFVPTVRVVKRVRLRLGRQDLSSAISRSTLALLATRAGSGFAITVMSSVLSLYIQSLDPGNPRLATLAGAVNSVSAVTSSGAAFAAGYLGDRFGQKTVLQACTIGATLIYIPQAFVGSVNHLLLLRAVQGLFLGGMLPTVSALLAQSSPPDKRGVVFGLATSAAAGGQAIGPALGAAAANAWGMPSTFLVTASIYAMLAGLVAALVPARFSQRANQEEPEREVALEEVNGETGANGS
ncbi:MAG: hypothetical protein A2Y73_02210 [Chloroflexi bacterium RBG_13_56_8]|nr:MAG: hypothetical protein A2Y73_02210 [Chloroflexi bacterium RBG_13_56_8]